MTNTITLHARKPSTGHLQPVEIALGETYRVTDLAVKSKIPTREIHHLFYALEQANDKYDVFWGVADDGYTDTVRIEKRLI